MPRSNLPPKELRHLPQVWLDALEEQCGGDWRRVYLDQDGVPIVGNMAREVLRPQGATARKLRQHSKATNGATHPTPKVMAGKTAPPTPKGLKDPPPPQLPAETPPRLTGFRAVEVAKVAPPVPPLPPLPEPEPDDETPCEICGLVGAHRRSCYNGLVAVSDLAGPPETPGPVAPPAPPPEVFTPEVFTPEPVVTRSVITTPTFVPPQAPPSITVNGRDIEDLPLREAPREAPERRPDRRQVITDETGQRWVLLGGLDGTNWEGLSPDDVLLTAHQVWVKVREGMPDEAPLYWHDDVTSLGGVDLDMVESAARTPGRVEIAPETSTKRYPVLRFWRGDVCTVVGFRTPSLPMVIAAYVSASAYNKHLGKTDAPLGKSGGGGKRRSVGIPRRPRTLEKRLVDMGAEVTEETDAATGNVTATVTYKGEEMGKYKVHPCVPVQIEKDWQRLQRKITAIFQRELAGKVAV